MSHLKPIALTVLPVSIADLLIFLYWYHLSNAQAKFLLYDPWLSYVNQRFIASGFVAGSLVLLNALGITLIMHQHNRWPRTAVWWQAIILNALIVAPGTLVITQTANFDPPLWTIWLALFWLVSLNSILFVVWQHINRLKSIIIVSLLLIGGYAMCVVVLFPPFYYIFLYNAPTTPQWTTDRFSLLLGIALPLFLCLAIGSLLLWHWRKHKWQHPPAIPLCLGVVLLWVPCFAVAHYIFASNIHYITNVDNLINNLKLALIYGPILVGLFVFANKIVVHQALRKYSH